MGWLAQQRRYTQYILNNYILNPALSGIENYTDLKLSFTRDQWVGYKLVRPKHFYLTIPGPIGRERFINDRQRLLASG